MSNTAIFFKIWNLQMVKRWANVSEQAELNTCRSINKCLNQTSSHLFYLFISHRSLNHAEVTSRVKAYYELCAGLKVTVDLQPWCFSSSGAVKKSTVIFTHVSTTTLQQIQSCVITTPYESRCFNRTFGYLTEMLTVAKHFIQLFNLKYAISGEGWIQTCPHLYPLIMTNII